jgi:N,N'-diacetyllegionaminate synthase
VSREFTIGERLVGDGHPAFVIAEVGINHNGDVSLAKEMISAAWESGADAVKIQTFITNEFLHPSHPSYKYDIDAEIPHESEQEIWEYAKQKKIRLFSTPEDLKSLAFLKQQNPPLVKIAAMDFNFPILIKKAAELQVPIILSSGMSNLEEVLRSVRWVKETGNPDCAVLHCVSCYPTPPEECNLTAIKTLKSVLSGPVGYSDHTIGIHIPLAAVALGANIIEKHFTLDKKIPGPDQISSMDPNDLSTLMQQIRELECAFGDGVKIPSKLECDPRQFKRRGIYAAVGLKSGQTLSESDVMFLAPSTEHSSVDDWSQFKGRTTAVDIPKGNIISRSNLI